MICWKRKVSHLWENKIKRSLLMVFLFEFIQTLGFTVDQVENVVKNCEKQRFALKEENGELLIRANQVKLVFIVYLKDGHSR